MTVWVASPVAEVASVQLVRWRVYETSAGDRHFAGRNVQRGTGRVSTAIVAFDAATQCGRTESGRVYELVGRPGRDTDGDYVWGRWLKINGNPTWRDVSEEYTPAQCAEKPKRPRRRISSSEGNEG